MSTQWRVLIPLFVVVALMGCVAAEQSPSGEAAGPSSSIETIVFADYNWPSAQIQNRIAQYIVEKGMAIPPMWCLARLCRCSKGYAGGIFR